MKTTTTEERPVAAETELVPMRPDAPLGEAGQGVLLQHLKKLRKNLPDAARGEVDGVHDARVATRRLRAGMKVLEETGYTSDNFQKFRRKLRKLANALAQTRDSDVLLEHLDNYLANLPGDKVVGLQELRQTISDRREEAQHDMLKVLEDKKTDKLLDKIEDFLSQPGGLSPQAPSDENEATPKLVRHFGGSAIWRRYEEVLAYETCLPANTAVMHRLRVATKHLRYTVEFFEEGLPGPAQGLIEQLTEVQDYLGKLQDHVVAIEFIGEISHNYQDSQALADYKALRESDRDKLLSGFGTIWENLSGPEFQRKLARALVGEPATTLVVPDGGVVLTTKPKSNRAPKNNHLN